MFHTINFRIYYEDTDAAGIVYYANYLKFAERARTEWLRELGFEQSKLLKESDIAFVVQHCTIDFLIPARLDDVITIETRLHEKGKVRMTMLQRIVRGETVLALLTVKLACVNTNGKPTRLPDTLSAALNR